MFNIAVTRLEMETPQERKEDFQQNNKDCDDKAYLKTKLMQEDRLVHKCK